MFNNKAILLLASALLAMPGAIQAQGVTPTAAGKGGTVSADQLITRYSGLAGGSANAKSLVNGLRTGADITLTWEEKGCTASQTTCNAYEQTCTNTNTTTCTQSIPPGCAIGTPGCLCLQTQTTTTTNCVDDTSKCKPGQSATTCTNWDNQPKNLTFSPGPAAPMGFGNVDIALALTEAHSASPTPSPSDLKQALMDVLNKRAAGQGWGEIAKGYGLQLK